MNKTRRNEIEAVKNRLAELKAQADEIIATLEQIRDDEQEYFDNMPEGLQASEKGEKAEAAVSALDDAINDLQDFADCDFESQLDTAVE